MVKDIAVGVGGLGFGSRAVRVGHSVAVAAAFFGAVLPRRQVTEMGLATRCALQLLLREKRRFDFIDYETKM